MPLGWGRWFLYVFPPSRIIEKYNPKEVLLLEMLKTVFKFFVILGIVFVFYTTLNSCNLVKMHYKDFSFETTEKSTPAK